jgi:hypothetical protein
MLSRADLESNRKMRFYTKDECEGWLQGLERVKPDCIPEIHRAHVHYPTSPGRILYLARWVAGSLMYRNPALVWITAVGHLGEQRELASVLQAAAKLR